MIHRNASFFFSSILKIAMGERSCREMSYHSFLFLQVIFLLICFEICVVPIEKVKKASRLQERERLLVRNKTTETLKIHFEKKIAKGFTSESHYQWNPIMKKTRTLLDVRDVFKDLLFFRNSLENNFYAAAFKSFITANQLLLRE